jgi:hypothetical protein
MICAGRTFSCLRRVPVDATTSVAAAKRPPSGIFARRESA